MPRRTERGKPEKFACKFTIRQTCKRIPRATLIVFLPRGRLLTAMREKTVIISISFESKQNNPRLHLVAVPSALPPPRLFFSPAGDILCLFLREEMAGEVIKRARVRV